MKLSYLSPETQTGLLRFALEALDDDGLYFEGIGSLPEHWAWLLMQLKVAQDRPEWFPKGRWATVQVIEQYLLMEAMASLPENCRKTTLASLLVEIKRHGV